MKTDAAFFEIFETNPDRLEELTGKDLPKFSSASSQALKKTIQVECDLLFKPVSEDEPEWMRLSTVCPAPAGAIQIRDVRAWHGGTPNLSDELRAIPNLEFYAPWFREPVVPGMSYADHKKLSPHGQHLTKFCVMDSSEELPQGYVVKPLPKLPTVDTSDT